MENLLCEDVLLFHKDGSIKSFTEVLNSITPWREVAVTIVSQSPYDKVVDVSIDDATYQADLERLLFECRASVDTSYC